MKEARRYNVLTGLIQVDLHNGKYIEYTDHLSIVEQLQERIKDLESAERTLINLGYKNKGGELWNPPVGKTPNFNLIDSLNEKIKELESEKHINEIKAQGIEEFIKLETERLAQSEDNQMFRAYGMLRRRLSGYLARLRTNKGNF